MKGIRIDYKTNFIYFKKVKISFEEAENFLIENYQIFLTEYTVKKTVKNSKITCHIDWQGVLGSSFFTILITDLCNKNINPQDKG